jgi:hypothetical protein
MFGCVAGEVMRRRRPRQNWEEGSESTLRIVVGWSKEKIQCRDWKSGRFFVTLLHS